MEEKNKIPTPYEWVGGKASFEKLTEVFYDKVLKDDVLEPVFRHMSPSHSKHVAAFLSESFGGGDFYSKDHGTQTMIHVVSKHLNKHLNETHRKRWMELILKSADEIGMPDDPEFRGVLTGHLEWGTRFAVMMSNESENPMSSEDKIPQFRWGDFGAPFGYGDTVFRKKNNFTAKIIMNTDPVHIKHWNTASEDWHTTHAENDLTIGGKFLSRMEAKDGSFGFDFCGTYDIVTPQSQLAYTMEDGRKTNIIFTNQDKYTKIEITFDAENENPIDMQKAGWQAILDNFKKYTESI
jgi:hemoglobin